MAAYAKNTTSVQSQNWNWEVLRRLSSPRISFSGSLNLPAIQTAANTTTTNPIPTRYGMLFILRSPHSPYFVDVSTFGSHRHPSLSPAVDETTAVRLPWLRRACSPALRWPRSRAPRRPPPRPRAEPRSERRGDDPLRLRAADRPWLSWRSRWWLVQTAATEVRWWGAAERGPAGRRRK